MANHNLFMGGLRTSVNTLGRGLYPQVPPAPDQFFVMDDRRGQVRFANSHLLDFSCEGCDSCSDTMNHAYFQAFRDYLNNNTIVVGDTIWTHIIPLETTLERVFWKIVTPITPFNFDIVFRNSTDLNDLTATTTVLAAGVSGAATGIGIVDVETVVAPLLLTSRNGLVGIKINSMPAAVVGGCGPCASGGLSGLVMCLSVTSEAYCRGEC